MMGLGLIICAMKKFVIPIVLLAALILAVWLGVSFRMEEGLAADSYGVGLVIPEGGIRLQEVQATREGEHLLLTVRMNVINRSHEDLVLDRDKIRIKTGDGRGIDVYFVALEPPQVVPARQSGEVSLKFLVTEEDLSQQLRFEVDDRGKLLKNAGEPSLMPDDEDPVVYRTVNW